MGSTVLIAYSTWKTFSWRSTPLCSFSIFLWICYWTLLSLTMWAWLLTSKNHHQITKIRMVIVERTLSEKQVWYFFPNSAPFLNFQSPTLPCSNWNPLKLATLTTGGLFEALWELILNSQPLFGQVWLNPLVCRNVLQVCQWQLYSELASVFSPSEGIHPKSRQRQGHMFF